MFAAFFLLGEIASALIVLVFKATGVIQISHSIVVNHRTMGNE